MPPTLTIPLLFSGLDVSVRECQWFSRKTRPPRTETSLESEATRGPHGGASRTCASARGLSCEVLGVEDHGEEPIRHALTSGSCASHRLPHGGCRAARTSPCSRPGALVPQAPPGVPQGLYVLCACGEGRDQG